MSRPEEDGFIEDLLRRREKSPQRAGPRLSNEKCNDPELLAAYAEGALSGTARDDFETHLASCDDCSEAVARLVRMAPRDAVAQAPPKPWAWMTRIVPALAGFVLVGSLVWYGRDRVFQQPQQPVAPPATATSAPATELPKSPVPAAGPEVTSETGRLRAPARDADMNARARSEQPLQREQKEKDGFAPSPPLAKVQAPPERSKLADTVSVADQETKAALAKQEPQVQQAGNRQAPSSQSINVQGLNVHGPNAQGQNVNVQGKTQANNEPAASPVASYRERADSKDAAVPAGGAMNNLAKKALVAGPAKDTAIGWRELDSRRIWALRAEGVLFYTSDAGRTWQQVATPEPARTFSFQDEKSGQITGRSGRVYNTSDGGKTWERTGRGGPPD